MRKRLASMVAAVLMMSLAACGSGNSSARSTSAENQSTTANESVQEHASDKSSQATTTTAVPEVSFEAFTPIDNDECSVTIKELDPKSAWGYTVKVVLENKSADKTYMFSVETASVNGVVADPLFAKEVAPGKKANESIIFMASELKENGITDFTDIDISFRVYDSNDWSADNVADETFHIYPQGEDKAVSFVRSSQSSDQILVDDDNVTVIITGKEDDSIWGYTLKLFIVNKTDTEIMVSADEASVNGYMLDPFFAKSVPAGKCAFSSMSWPHSALEENGITEVTQIEGIEFKLRVYDSNNWSASDFFNDVIKVTP